MLWLTKQTTSNPMLYALVFTLYNVHYQTSTYRIEAIYKSSTSVYNSTRIKQNILEAYSKKTIQLPYNIWCSYIQSAKVIETKH